jgi:hypothetical protein
MADMVAPIDALETPAIRGSHNKKIAEISETLPILLPKQDDEETPNPEYTRETGPQRGFTHWVPISRR